MKNFILIIFLFHFFISCNSDCNLHGFERVKKNELKLNSNAEQALNKITNILNGGYTTSTIHVKENNVIVEIYTHQAYNIYFKLNEKRKIFYISDVQFKNYERTKDDFERLFILPIEELLIENISFSVIESERYVDEGKLAAFIIDSRYNDSSFTLKQPKECYSTNQVVMYLRVADAIELKRALTKFLKNF